jgi:long-chain acyl-CoA synthetase
VLRAIEEFRITNVTLIPTMFKMLLDHPDYPRSDLSSLRCIVYGAAPMPDAVLQTAMRTLPHARFVQAYGQTELSPIATILRPRYHVLEGSDAAKRTSCGQAALGVEILITDPDGNEQPRGTVGEIRVRGPNTMLGYWQKPAETTQTLVAGWVRTGDGGYMDEDGFIYVVDRLKDMVISGGENIYSVEVEAAIMSHAAVGACAVIGIPDERWGERVHAIVVPRSGCEVSAGEIITHCHERIAGYKCPKSVEIRSQALPLSGAGKILKRELREPFWQGHARRVS